MVVCNTVKSAQTVYKELESLVKNALLLHGRFVLKDREHIESQLKDASLLVGTQAIEVSLDLDFDVLFSEPAPIDALIQRFGRVNRKNQKEICQVNVCRVGGPSDKYIYSEEITQKTIKALESVDVLHDSRIQDLVNFVYETGYNNEQEEKYNFIIDLFKRHLKDLFPFIDNQDGKHEFEGLFKSIEVVPACYQNEYLECIEEKRYYDAMSFITQISENQFRILRDKGLIHHIGENNHHFVDVEYDPTLGLLIENKNHPYIEY